MSIKVPAIGLDGIIKPGRESEQLFQTLSDDFMTLKMPGGRPVFGHIMANLLLKANDPSTRLLGLFTERQMSHPITEMNVITGKHRPFGILFVRGPRVNARSMPDKPHSYNGHRPHRPTNAKRVCAIVYERQSIV